MDTAYVESCQYDSFVQQRTCKPSCSVRCAWRNLCTTHMSIIHNDSPTLYHRTLDTSLRLSREDPFDRMTQCHCQRWAIMRYSFAGYSCWHCRRDNLLKTCIGNQSYTCNNYLTIAVDSPNCAVDADAVDCRCLKLEYVMGEAVMSSWYCCLSLMNYYCCYCCCLSVVPNLWHRLDCTNIAEALACLNYCCCWSCYYYYCY